MNSNGSDQPPSEKEALEQFRKNLSDILTPDVTDKILLKWLRAKNFNLKKSEELYRTNLRIRQIFRAEELENMWKIPEVLRKYGYTNYLGIAKDGTPIRYMALGRGDLKGLYMSLDNYDIIKYCVWKIEKDLRRCKEQSRKLGREIDEMTYIMDMSGFNIRQVWWFSGIIEIAMDLFRMVQEHYPEIWENVLIVNAPFYFHSMYNFFKPMFGFYLLEKIKVASRYQSARLLLKYIDADVLPQFLGGKRIDSKGNPMCTEFMKFGGTVPEEYFLRNRRPLLPSDPGVEDYWLPPKGYLNMTVVVREANSMMHLELRSEGGSLPMMLLYRKFESDPDEHIHLPGRYEFLDPRNEKHKAVDCGPLVHMHTHISPLDNYAYAAWPGIYIFRVDNSYNWLSGRRCIFRITVEPPGTFEDKIKKIIST